MPAVSEPGAPLPLEIPAARLRSSDVGGVLVVNVNVRSGLTVTSTGVGIPGSRCPVFALNSWKGRSAEHKGIKKGGMNE